MMVASCDDCAIGGDAFCECSTASWLGNTRHAHWPQLLISRGVSVRQHLTVCVSAFHADLCVCAGPNYVPADSAEECFREAEEVRKPAGVGAAAQVAGRTSVCAAWTALPV